MLTEKSDAQVGPRRQHRKNIPMNFFAGAKSAARHLLRCYFGLFAAGS
ncbi:MAG: hypothetical protein MJY78_11290 [Fibrobacter sp.]|nr:hypothetical protein [Fibrobacter sp.]